MLSNVKKKIIIIKTWSKNTEHIIVLDKPGVVTQQTRKFMDVHRSGFKEEF